MKILCIALLLFSNWVYAQSWEFVSISEDGIYYFINPSSIAKSGSDTKFTQMSNHPRGFQYDENLVYSIITHRTANCSENTYKSGHLFGYPDLNAQGGIEVTDFKHDTRWIKVKPDTMASFMQKRVCLGYRTSN